MQNQFFSLTLGYQSKLDGKTQMIRGSKSYASHGLQKEREYPLYSYHEYFHFLLTCHRK